MPHYLFSNDQRISVLEERIKWVAEFISLGKKISDIKDKSDNNNATTLAFYYDLYPNTENIKKAVTSPQEVIRNFILKFQYPNPRTQESLNDSLAEGVFLAPYRAVVSLIVALAKAENVPQSKLSLDEILYYIFANPQVYKNPSLDYALLANRIIKEREQEVDLSTSIERDIVWKQRDRQVREMMTVLAKCIDCFSLYSGILTYTPNKVDEDFINKIIDYNYFWLPSNKENTELTNKEYISYMNMADTPYNVVDFTKEKKFVMKKGLYPLQQITYGAPGTGKSYGLNDIIDSMDHYRTTFHPDSDYASFVGAYKPTMSKVVVKNNYAVLDDGNKTEEEQITYKFVPQSFIKAYVSAWKNYKEDKPTVLVIEEINRGNCAQIFGDLFQLLDRGNNGFSSYPIEADADVANYLNGEMPNLTECAESIDTLFAKSYPEGITSKIKSGELLLLPNNLYIWATMNTSDQSLFPIDSAFKRRWDWKFIKIADARKSWFIKFGNEGCDWWTFISKMNKLIAKETSSDDKKMGYFFCKPQNEDEQVIKEDQFVGKVLFYLWNDVFKDGDTALFNVSDDTDDEPTFEAFYNDDNTPDVEAIKKFIVKVVGQDNIVGLDKADDGKTSIIDYSRYSFDGKDKLPKSSMGLMVVEKYIKEHENDSFDDLKAALSFNNAKDEYLYYGAIACSEDINTHRDCYTEKEYLSADSVKFKILTYWNKYNKKYIIDFAKQQGWEVKETEAE